MKRDFIFLLSNKVRYQVTVPARDRYFVFKGLLYRINHGTITILHRGRPTQVEG